MIVDEICYCGIPFVISPIVADDIGITEVHQRYTNTKKHPLHKYGVGPFCEFHLPVEMGDRKGIYIFIVNGQIKYVGRCLNSFKKRISKGYGHISPRNCFEGGQPTNCHINRELNVAFEKGAEVCIGIHSMDDNAAIRALEKKILKEQDSINPDNWNIHH